MTQVGDIDGAQGELIQTSAALAEISLLPIGPDMISRVETLAGDVLAKISQIKQKVLDFAAT